MSRLKFKWAATITDSRFAILVLDGDEVLDTLTASEARAKARSLVEAATNAEVLKEMSKEIAVVSALDELLTRARSIPESVRLPIQKTIEAQRSRFIERSGWDCRSNNVASHNELHRRITALADQGEKP